MKTCRCEKTFPFSEHVKLLSLFEHKVIFWNYWAAKKCLVYRVFHKPTKTRAIRVQTVPKGGWLPNDLPAVESTAADVAEGFYSFANCRRSSSLRISSSWVSYCNFKRRISSPRTGGMPSCCSTGNPEGCSWEDAFEESISDFALV